MKKITAIYLMAGFLFIATGIIAIWLNKTSQVDRYRYHQKTTLIHQIQEQTKELIHETLLLEKGESLHYDKVAKLLNSNDILIARLVSDDQATAVKLLVAWNQLKTNVEDIKSDYAVYQNSLRYFPKGTKILLLELSAHQKYKKITHALLSLERRVMQFGLEHDSLLSLNNDLTRFNQFTEKLPNELAFSMRVLSRHVEIILTKYQRLQQLHTQLLNNTVAFESKILLEQYSRDFQQQVDQAVEIRTVFYRVCIALVLVFIVVLSRFRR